MAEEEEIAKEIPEFIKNMFQELREVFHGLNMQEKRKKAQL